MEWDVLRADGEEQKWMLGVWEKEYPGGQKPGKFSWKR